MSTPMIPCIPSKLEYLKIFRWLKSRNVVYGQLERGLGGIKNTQGFGEMNLRTNF